MVTTAPEDFGEGHVYLPNVGDLAGLRGPERLDENSHGGQSRSGSCLGWTRASVQLGQVEDDSVCAVSFSAPRANFDCPPQSSS